MKVFIAEHDGHHLGGYSVIVANTKEEAMNMLKHELWQQKLRTDGIEIEEVDTTQYSVNILFNGDY